MCECFLIHIVLSGYDKTQRPKRKNNNGVGNPRAKQ